MVKTANGDANPIDRLADAAAQIPADTVAARAALSEAANFFRTSSEKARDARAVADALGKIVTSLEAENPVREQEIEEFGAHLATYNILAESLSTALPVQVAPTQTQGKDQSGGKA